jgi:hypothetical protein
VSGNTASINEGLLTVNGQLTANSVVVNQGGTVGGSGMIFAPVTVSGSLSPGNSPGALSMAALTLTPTAVTNIEIETLTNFDRIVVGGAATVDGTLNVTPHNSNPIAYAWNLNQKIALIPEVRGFWMHEFLNNPRNISSSLEGGGPSFDYETSAPYRNSVFGVLQRELWRRGLHHQHHQHLTRLRVLKPIPTRSRTGGFALGEASRCRWGCRRDLVNGFFGQTPRQLLPIPAA